MSFGIGAFPFGFFATNFNFGDGAIGQGPMLYKAFLSVAWSQFVQPLSSESNLCDQLTVGARNTKGGSITVPLTSCLTGLE